MYNVKLSWWLIKYSQAIRQDNWLRITDISHTISVPIVRVVTACPDCPTPIHTYTYICTCSRVHIEVRLWASGGAGRWSQVLTFLDLSLDRWNPVKVSGVQPDLRSLLYYAIHLTRDKPKQNKHLILLTSPPLALGRCIYQMVWICSHMIALMIGMEMIHKTLVILN